MNEDPLKNKKTKQEQLDIKVKLATPEDWQTCRELRLLLHSGKDREMFGVTSENKDERIRKIEDKSEQEWRKDLRDKNLFMVLAWDNVEAVGTEGAKKREEKKDWYLHTGYTKEDFRGMGIGKKMLAACLEEIKKRDGKKVMLGVKTVNAISIHIAELFGFKKAKEDSSPGGFYMELEDVNDHKVIKKIDEVLNER